MLTETETRYAVKIEMQTLQNECSPPTREEIPLVAAIKRAVKAVYGVDGKAVGIGGGTVGAHLRKKAIDTVVWAKLESTAHMPNEYCVIQNMLGDAKVMAQVMIE